MDIKTKALILTVESKPYAVDGNEGISHKIRVNVGGEIYVCKSSAEQVQAMKSLEKVSGDAHIRVNSRKESLSLELVSFTASK